MRAIPTNGDALQRLRKKRAWTQVQLAQLSGCSVRTISNTERGRKVDFDILSQIAAALEVPLSTLTVNSASSDRIEQRNVERIIQWHEYYVEQNVEQLLKMHHDRTLLELPGTEAMPMGGTFQGLKQHAEHYEGLFQIFPVTMVHSMLIDAVGNRVYARPTATLKSLQTDQEFTLAHANVFEFYEDKIVHRISYMDLGTYRDTLGPSEFEKALA